jgi:transcriptional regulator with XRE-family HTH domain
LEHPHFYANFALFLKHYMMTNITSQQKKDYAKTLFLKDTLTQAEIAERVGVSRITVNKWASAGKWEELKAGITITRDNLLADLYRQVAEINKAIAAKPEGARYPDANEAQIRAQITADIKKLQVETGLDDIIDVLTKFINWIRNADLAQAKVVATLADAFIKSKL